MGDDPRAQGLVRCHHKAPRKSQRRGRDDGSTGQREGAGGRESLEAVMLLASKGPRAKERRPSLETG